MQLQLPMIRIKEYIMFISYFSFFPDYWKIQNIGVWIIKASLYIYFSFDKEVLLYEISLIIQ